MEGFQANTTVVMADLKVQVERALTLLDPDLRQAYTKAVEAVPSLVETESKVEDFLRVQDYHALRDARRLALFCKDTPANVWQLSKVSTNDANGAPQWLRQ